MGRLSALVLPLLLLSSVLASPLSPPSQQPSSPSQYSLLPPLREQARIQDGWRDERFKLASGMMKKYGVDVWIMSMLEYSEDTGESSISSAESWS